MNASILALASFNWSLSWSICILWILICSFNWLVVSDTRVLPCKVFQYTFDLVDVVVQPPRDHAITMFAEETPDFSCVVIVIDTEVMSIFSRSKLPRVSLTYVARAVLLSNETFVFMLLNAILLLQSLVVGWFKRKLPGH